jgi:hypothetical protein
VPPATESQASEPEKPAAAAEDVKTEAPTAPLDDGTSQPFPDAEFTPVGGGAEEGAQEAEEGSEVIEVSFDAESSDEPAAPPEVTRVQVSNQMDILAELDGLRKQATMGAGNRQTESPAPELDLDSLISGDTGQSRELRRKIEKAVNSDIFKTMRGMQIAIRLQNEGGDTIHSFDPVSLEIEDATTLKKLCLRLSLDLENLR